VRVHRLGDELHQSIIKKFTAPLTYSFQLFKPFGSLFQPFRPQLIGQQINLDKKKH